MAQQLGVAPILSPKQPPLWKGAAASNTQRFPSPIRTRNRPRIRAVSLDEFPPNALRRERDPNWWGGFSLGVDTGMSRTGLAVSKGFSFRPLTVLEVRGQRLELRLLEIAEQQDVDEFIIGLPKSWDGKETKQSNKVRSIAGRLAVRAAERGLSKSARQGRVDAYAAVVVLEKYFEMSGRGVELVLPKQLELQKKLRIRPPRDLDF